MKTIRQWHISNVLSDTYMGVSGECLKNPQNIYFQREQTKIRFKSLSPEVPFLEIQNHFSIFRCVKLFDDFKEDIWKTASWILEPKIQHPFVCALRFYGRKTKSLLFKQRSRCSKRFDFKSRRIITESTLKVSDSYKALASFGGSTKPLEKYCT